MSRDAVGYDLEPSEPRGDPEHPQPISSVYDAIRPRHGPPTSRPTPSICRAETCCAAVRFFHLAQRLDCPQTGDS